MNSREGLPRIPQEFSFRKAVGGMGIAALISAAPIACTFENSLIQPTSPPAKTTPEQTSTSLAKDSARIVNTRLTEYINEQFINGLRIQSSLETPSVATDSCKSVKIHTIQDSNLGPDNALDSWAFVTLKLQGEKIISEDIILTFLSKSTFPALTSVPPNLDGAKRELSKQLRYPPSVWEESSSYAMIVPGKVQEVVNGLVGDVVMPDGSIVHYKFTNQLSKDRLPVSYLVISRERDAFTCEALMPISK